MRELAPLHGGSRLPVAWDLSTNANLLGPCPAARAAAAGADLARYPDPCYESTRAALAARHGCDPRRVVVGAGASELILRLVRRHAGPVRVLGPSFSEYRRCALLEGRSCVELARPEQLPGDGGGGLSFACWPNNPTGDCWDLEALAGASSHCRLVLDLAYADLIARGEALRVARQLPGAWQLFSPNKAFGLTGLRAAYAIVPEEDPLLEHLAPSWVLDAAGCAFLEASVATPALDWLDETRPELQRLRRDTAALFRSHRIEVLESPANYLMARVGDARRFRAVLLEHGVCVRDAASFGMPDWVRLAGAPPRALEIISRHLDSAGLPRTSAT